MLIVILLVTIFVETIIMMQLSSGPTNFNCSLIQVCYGQPLRVKDFGFTSVTDAAASIPDTVTFCQSNVATSEVVLKSTDPQASMPAIVPTAVKQKIEAIIRDMHTSGATMDEIALRYKVNIFKYSNFAFCHENHRSATANIIINLFGS